MSERSIYLLGAGGHGRVLLDVLHASGMQAAGIIDPGLAQGASVAGVPVLGGDAILNGLDPANGMLVLGVGANPDTGRRAMLFLEMKRRGWDFLSVSHPSAILAAEIAIGQGCQRMAGAIVQSGVRLGANVVLNTGATIDHDCVVGDHVFISPGATICGAVIIGPETFIGAGAVIVPGVTIGQGAVIGAGAVVLRNIEDGETAMGVPACSRKRASHV